MRAEVVFMKWRNGGVALLTGGGLRPLTTFQNPDGSEALSEVVGFPSSQVISNQWLDSDRVQADPETAN